MSDAFDLVSPCVGVCTLDPRTGLCCGCLRTAGEISEWPDLSYDDKRALLERLQDRRREAGWPSRRSTRRRRRRAPSASSQG
ncbi:MAG: DUF1289 domain-containing protein [Alphaproteobacteria bacterium]